MLRDCVNAVKAIVTPAQVEVMRKVEMANFQLQVATEPTEKYYLSNLFTEYESMTMLGNCWKVWVSRPCRIMRNECGCWTI